MAVELRCPDCRAKLRLQEAPDAGTEVECPKCGTVFAAPEPETAGDDDDAPKKKKKPARNDSDDTDEKPTKGAKGKSKEDDADEKKEKKEKKTKKKSKSGADANAPRKRKAKKNKTSKVALFAVLGIGLFMLIGVGGMLLWFFARTPKSIEMMYYLPEDCDTVQGLNLGHAQKYPEFYKTLSTSFKDTEFKVAGDTLAKTLKVGDGESPGDALIEYIVFGSARSGSATVIRTKEDIDGAGLAKLPGAETKSLGGQTYYLANGFKGGGKVRVFAPTSRLIVYCPANAAELSEAVFQKMLNGHGDSKEKTVGVRAGELGKRVTKGTFWSMIVYAGEKKPPAGPQPGAVGPDGNPPAEDEKAQLDRTVSEALGGSKGMGFKASIGSREVRFEVIVWCSDSETSSSMTKKWKESELGKGDEGTPPRWWKTNVDGLGNKKIGAQLLANLGFGSSGELFYAKSAVETSDLKDAIGSMANKITGTSPGGQPPTPRRRRVWVPGRRVWARR